MTDDYRRGFSHSPGSGGGSADAGSGAPADRSSADVSHAGGLALNSQTAEFAARFQALVQATAQIVWHTAPDGRFADPQPDWAAYTGQSFEEYRDFGWMSAVHPGDRERVAGAWAQAVAGRTMHVVEYRARRHDGVYRDFVVRAVPVLEPDGATVREWVGMHADVTERNTAERALLALNAQLETRNEQLQSQALEFEAQAEELEATAEELLQRTREALLAREAAEAERTRLRSVFEQFPSAAAILEGPDLVFVAASEQYARLVGQRGLIGRPFAAALPELAAQGFAELMARVRDSGEAERGVGVAARWDRDGSGVAQDGVVDFVYQPLPSEGDLPAGVAIVVMDVTERWRTEHANSVLAAASGMLGASLDYERTLSDLTRVVVPAVADWCAVDALEPDGTIRRIGATHVDPAKAAAANEAFRRSPPTLDDDAGLGAVLRTGTPELVADLAREGNTAGGGRGAHRELVASLGAHAAVVAPLDVRGRRFGAITLAQAESGRSFTGDDLALARELAQRAAGAVENAQLFREAEAARATAEAAARRTTSLQELTARLAGAITPEQVSAVVIAQAFRAVDAAVGLLTRVSADGAELQLLGTANLPAELADEWRHYPLTAAGPMAEAVGRRATVSVPTARDLAARYPERAHVFGQIGARAAYAVPLVLGERILGAMLFLWTEERTLDAADAALVAAIADQCAQALERTRLYDAEREARAVSERAAAVAQHRSDQLGALTHAALAVNAALSVEEVLQLATDHARSIVGAHQSIATLTLRRDWSHSIHSVSTSDTYPAPAPSGRADTGVPDSPGIAALVARLTAPVRLTRAEVEGSPLWRGLSRHAHGRPPERGWLAVPLVSRDGQNVGFLQLSDKVDGGEFSETDEAIAVQLAQLAVVAIENARLLEQARVARRDAEAANQAKMQFLATMSHELRTPLNAVMGHTELIAMGLHGPVTAEQLDALTRVRRGGQFLLSMINDLLNFARLEAGRVELDVGEVAVAELLAGAETLVGPQFRAKGLTFSHAAVPGGPDCGALVVRADGEKARQILVNLLTNAMKFTTTGGVTIECETPTDDLVAIRVRDTGRGIPREKLMTIFEPFVQVDRHLTEGSQQGVGLGLAISRDLARLMGGDLTAESEVGAGSTFTLTLPRVAGGA